MQLHGAWASGRPLSALRIEDYDPRFLDRTFPTVDARAAAVYRRGYTALAQVVERHVRPAGWGRGRAHFPGAPRERRMYVPGGGAWIGVLHGIDC